MLELRSSWPQIGRLGAAAGRGFTAERMARRYQELYDEWLRGARSRGLEAVTTSSSASRGSAPVRQP